MLSLNHRHNHRHRHNHKRYNPRPRHYNNLTGRNVRHLVVSYSVSYRLKRTCGDCSKNARIAHGNAQLLNEALAFASPEDLREKEIIKVRVRISLSRSEGPDDLLRNGIRSASVLRTCLQRKYRGRQQEQIDRALLVKLNYRYSNSNSVQPSDQMDWVGLIY